MSDGTMKSIANLVDCAKATGNEKQHLETISKPIWAKVWMGLIAQKHISKVEEVGSSTCEYWRRSCQDAGLSEAEVINGCKLAKEHTEFLGMGAFIQLCRKPKTEQAHKPFERLQNKAAGPAAARRHLDDLFRSCPELCPEQHRERLGL